jgi:hypothetical protein
MYGRYTKELGEYAKEEARRVKVLERRRKKEDRLRNKELQKYRGKCASKVIAAFSFVWRHTFARLGEDWVFLALLGIIMAFISFLMDRGISICNQGIVPLFCRVVSAAHSDMGLKWACARMIRRSVTLSRSLANELPMGREFRILGCNAMYYVESQPQELVRRC